MKSRRRPARAAVHQRVACQPGGRRSSDDRHLPCVNINTTRHQSTSQLTHSTTVDAKRIICLQFLVLSRYCVCNAFVIFASVFTLNVFILQTFVKVEWRWALVSPDGVAPSRMVGVSASVNLPLHHKVQKFCSGTGSPGWSRKKGP